MNNIDASITNADWTKTVWDLPSDISYYEFRYGKNLGSYVERLMLLPVADAMPNDLKAEFARRFPAAFESKTYYLDPETKTRYVRDADYWGVPYGTPITPGMKPQGQMVLPGMPKLPMSEVANPQRLEQFRVRVRGGFPGSYQDGVDDEKSIEEIRMEYRRYEYLLQQYEKWAWDSEGEDIDRIKKSLYDEFGIDPYELESHYEDLDDPARIAVATGDWLYFGACRDIRNAAYSMLGFDESDREADPHAFGGDPGWGGAGREASAPDTLAYGILKGMVRAEKTEMPIYRGIDLQGWDAEDFIADLRREDAFDLPVASFVGNEESARRFGTDVIFKLEKGARYIRGGYMGVPESVIQRLEEQGEDTDVYEFDQEDDYREIVSGGRFKVVRVKQEDATFIVTIRQVGVYNPDNGLLQKAARKRWKWAFLFDNSLMSLHLAQDSKARENIKSMLIRGTIEEKGVRRVRDPEYWGRPYGTIITPGMKPVGPKAIGTGVKPPSVTPGTTKKPKVSKPKPSSGMPKNTQILIDGWPMGEKYPSTGWIPPLDDVTLPDGREIHIITAGDSPGAGMYNGSYYIYDKNSGELMGRLDYQSANGMSTRIAMVEVEPKYQRQGIASVLLARLVADFPGEIDPGMTTTEGTAWWREVSKYLKPEEKPKPEPVGDIITDFGEINARMNRYAIDDGRIADLRDEDRNPRLLKAVLAERLEDLLGDVATEDLIELGNSMFAEGQEPWSKKVDESVKDELLFALTGALSDYEKWKRSSGEVLGRSESDIEESIARFDSKEFYVRVTRSGELIVEENTYLEGTIDLLGREPFLVGTPEAEMLVRQDSISKMIATWAASSNDNNVLSLAIQEAVKEEFGIQESSDWVLVNMFPNRIRATEDGVKKLYRKHGKALRRFVRVQYEETQRIFKEMNIAGITVYRGMAVKRSDPIAVATGEALNNRGSWVTSESVLVDLKSRPLSSWSSRPETAVSFAVNIAPGEMHSRSLSDRPTSVVFKDTVRVEDIFCSPLSGFGCWGEKEFIVLGGIRKDVEAMRGTAINIWSSLD